MDAGVIAQADGERRAMNPLSAAYGTAIGVRNELYDRGTLRSHALKHAVISVGNISAGGAGKTPFVVLLGRLLQQKQIAFDILSRGYGRRDRAIRLVDTDGTVDLYGDEPLLLARELEVPVIVGADRVAAGGYAEELFSEAKPAHGKWLHLLDDGFQHRRLARNFDIVLLSRKDLEDALLPVGRLREPLSAVQRADAIVLTDDTPESALPDVAAGKHIWRVRRRVELASPAPARVVAFCGVARPSNFFADLRGVGVGETKVFPDHHRYSSADVASLLELKRRSSAEVFVTTAKDIVNLKSAGLLDSLQPVIELRLRMEFVSPSSDEIFAMIMRAVE
jgi:tetraacyldisaccharide 4'-kinase